MATLPIELNSFVGREEELDQLAESLADSALVTVAGPGGAGKTRLVLHLAHELAETDVFADGIVLVELAPVAEPRLVPQTVASALGVVDPASEPLLDIVTRVLGTRHLLLILDNCEHLLDACAELVAQLLAACPRVRVLCTSREPLHLSGEAVYRVPPLGLPPLVPGADELLPAVLDSPAGRLFVQRARAARSDFQLTAANVAAVAAICRRLDGLPLAIELAAARVGAFSPGEIAHRLDDALSVAGRGPRNAPPRQQTLTAAMDWSYALLEESERRLFRYLSVFGGGFTLDVTHCFADELPGAPELLARLVTRSMVQLDVLPDGEVRYRLLEPLRQFAHCRLAQAGELHCARQVLVRYVLGLVERVAADTLRPSLPRATQHLTRELDNVRLALEWTVQAVDTVSALRLASALWLWWSRPDRQAEGRVWLERVLSLPHAAHYTAYWRRARLGHAYLSLQQSDAATAASITEELTRGTPADDDLVLASLAANVHGTALAQMGEDDRARSVTRTSIQKARQAGLDWVAMLGYSTLGQLDLCRGDLQAAEQHLHNSLRIARADGDPWSKAVALIGIGDLLRVRGDYARAGRAYEQSSDLFISIDPPRQYVPQGVQHNQAYVALAGGDIALAARLFLACAETYRTVGTDRRGLAECVIGLGSVAARAGQPLLGARLFGAGGAALDALGARLTPANQADFERGRAALRGTMPAASLEREQAAGRELTLEEAIALARPLTEPALPPRPAAAPVAAPAAPRGVRQVDPLTRREREVAQLVARGLRNRDIAEALVITEKTAANHVQHILDKLRLTSRSELAARADELGLRPTGGMLPAHQP